MGTTLMRHPRLETALVAAASALTINAAVAQTFPAKPVRMVTITSGVVDALARVMTERMSEGLGQPVVLDPVLGGGGGIAATQVARSAPDGYTLLVTYPDPLLMRHLLIKDVPYDTLRDFTPVSVMIDATMGFAVKPELPVNTLQEFIAYAKANPNKVNYGSGGYGSSFQMAGEALKQHAGFTMTYVPYKSTAEAQIAFLRGDLEFLPSALATGLPLHRAGKLRYIAIINNERAAALPDLPSTREVVPGYSSPPYWTGVVGPAKLPAPVLQRLHAEIAKAVQTPEFRKRAEDASFKVVGNTPEEFRRRLEGELEYMGKTARAAGIKPE
jgi:tripartite-type tricarboxylate transporter receptor subunit TctC